jgi:hypothetical protein
MWEEHTHMRRSAKRGNCCMCDLYNDRQTHGTGHTTPATPEGVDAGVGVVGRVLDLSGSVVGVACGDAAATTTSV